MEYLIDYAVKNLWCTPSQDSQYTFALRRITPAGGFMGSWSTLMINVRAPTNDARYHLFQIGGLYPKTADLVEKQGVWIKLSDSARTAKTYMVLYFATGIHIPLTQAYFIYTYDRCLLIAVRHNDVIGRVASGPRLCDYNSDQVYWRVYQNAFYTTARWQALQTSVSRTIPDPIVVGGQTITNLSQVATLNAQVQVLKNNVIGTVLLFRNGYCIDTSDTSSIAVGDYYEYIYDASVNITSLIEAIGNLGLFNSAMDARRKYLLHIPTTNTSVYYNDDMEVYLFHPTKRISLYVHRNAPNTVRNLTHIDYSLRQDVIQGLQATSQGQFTDSTVRVMCFLRHSGYDRPLPDEHQRIKELYKLTDAQVKQAMVGTNATVPEWAASNLEKSEYPKVMSAQYAQLNTPDVANAMGYNAVAKLAGTAVEKLSGSLASARVVDVPYLYQGTSSVFFYDTQGFLVGSDMHTNGSTHLVPANAQYVEWVKGHRGWVLDDHLDEPSTVIDPNWDYRYYIRPKVSNPQVNAWVDVTGDQTKVRVINGVAAWVTGVQDTMSTLIRSNSEFFWKRYLFNMADGLIVINMASMISVNDAYVERVLEVPPGELDVFLNGRSLINGLDYFVNFPTITVVNKEYLVSQGSQTIDIRMKGLCNADMTFTDVAETGFMVAGQLSVDHQFDTRDDKPQRMQILGRIITSADVVFNEAGSTYSTANAWEGKPYAIKDIIVPMKEITGVDTVTYRARSKSMDTRVMNYLTQFAAPPPEPPITSIPNRHKLFSPLIAKLAMAMWAGDFTPGILTQQYNDIELQQAIAPYMYLYDMDPINPKNRPLVNYVEIHPTHMATTLSLNVYQYTLLERVVRLLAPGLVTLTGSIVLV
jgi:hypothetical protein